MGRALMLDARRRHPALEVEVYEANAVARGFYARIGSVETGRHEWGDQDRPLPLIAMRLAG